MSVAAIRQLVADAQRVAANPLASVEAFLSRFVAYPSEHARIAHTLWIAHTHAMDAWESTPRIAFLSPEPGSGKSRALEVSELLVPRPVQAINVSPSYLFRSVSSADGVPTILFDEVDTVFGPKAKHDNEDVRGLLNAGHRRGAITGRCEVRGKTVVPVDYPAYCAVALAGLGDLPDTILTRSVIVRMRRRGPGEVIEPFRRRVHQPDGDALRGQLESWVLTIGASLAEARPEMPAGIADRDADVWEALLALADAAGGTWPERARVAAVALVADSRGKRESLGLRLLADLKVVFGDRDVMGTAEIIKALCSLDEAPWGDLRGKPIDARGIAHRLGAYGIKSKNIRVGDQTPKGYVRADLWDAWQRYLSLFPVEAATSATHATNGAGRAEP